MAQLNLGKGQDLRRGKRCGRHAEKDCRRGKRFDQHAERDFGRSKRSGRHENTIVDVENRVWKVVEITKIVDIVERKGAVDVEKQIDVAKGLVDMRKQKYSTQKKRGWNVVEIVEIDRNSRMQRCGRRGKGNVRRRRRDQHEKEFDVEKIHESKEYGRNNKSSRHSKGMVDVKERIFNVAKGVVDMIFCF